MPGEDQYGIRQKKALFSHQPEQNPFLPNMDPMAGGMSRPAPSGGGGGNPLAQSLRQTQGPSPQQTAELARLQALVLPNRMVAPAPMPSAQSAPQSSGGMLDRLRQMLSPTAPGHTFGYRGYDPEQSMLLDQFNRVNTGAPGVPSAARIFSQNQGLVRQLLRPEQQYAAPGGL